VWSQEPSTSDRPPSRSSRSTRAATAPFAPEDASDERSFDRLEEKLDRVLANQEAILKKFEQVMEELRIIKVRATIRS
jgi:hypothetical protein